MPLPIFSERLKDLMLIEGVSQHKLSSAANVQRKSVSNWLRGINYPRYDALIRVADYFRISTDYLIGINNTAELEKTQQTPLLQGVQLSLTWLRKIKLKRTLLQE